MVKNRSIKISWKLLNSETKLNFIIEEYKPKNVQIKKDKKFAVLLFGTVEEAIKACESIVDRDLKVRYLGGDRSLTMSRINNTSLFTSTLDGTSNTNVGTTLNETAKLEVISQIKSDTQPMHDNATSVTIKNNNDHNVLTESITSNIIKDSAVRKPIDINMAENKSRISNNHSNVIKSDRETPEKAKHIKNIVVFNKEVKDQVLEPESDAVEEFEAEMETGAVLEDKKTILSNRIENIVNTSISTPTRQIKSKNDNNMENDNDNNVVDRNSISSSNKTQSGHDKLTHGSRIETALPRVEEEDHSKILQEEEVDDTVSKGDDEFDVLSQSENHRHSTFDHTNAESIIMMEQNTINVLPEDHHYDVSDSFEEHKNLIDSAPKGSFFHQSNFHDSEEPPALSRSDLDLEVDMEDDRNTRVDSNVSSNDSTSLRVLNASQPDELEDDMIPTRMSDLHQRKIPLSFSASNSIKDKNQHSTIIRHYYDEKAKDLRKKNEVYYQENQLLLSEVDELRIRVKLLEEQRNTRDRERRDYENEIHLMQQSWDIQEVALKKRIDDLESHVRTLKVENSKLHKTKIEVWRDVSKIHDVRQQLNYDNQLSKIQRSIVDVENHVDHYNRWVKSTVSLQQDGILNDIHSIASNVAMKLTKSNKAVSRLGEKYGSHPPFRNHRQERHRLTKKEKSSRSSSKYKSSKDKLAGSGPVA